MRLIDADALKALIDDGWGEGPFKNAFFEEIDDTPTIDPAENGGCWGCQCALLVDALMKHGEWIDNKAAFHFVCSECGCTVRMDKGQVFDRIEDEYNYCPNCGAKMDGGE